MPMTAVGEHHGDGPSLPVLATKRVPEPVKFPFTAYSHAHDLLAIVTTPSEVNVFRVVSGQVAFTIKRGKDGEINVTALAWKVDGGCLGVGWSDGSFEIYDGGSGRSIHTTYVKSEDDDDADEWRLYFPTPRRDVRGKEVVAAKSESKVCGRVECLGWMGHEVGSRSARSDAAEDLTTDDWFDEADESVLDVTGMKQSGAGVMDLPRAIATLDVTKVLPRLSAVPVAQTNFRPGPEGIKYATQAATDAVFDTQKESDPNMVQSLIVGQDDGTVEVLVDETVKIGSLNVGGRPILHAAHPRSPSHIVLNEAPDSGLQLSYIDLPLSTFSGAVLHVIASNTKRIQSQLDYIIYTLRCIEHDFSSGVEIPNRYLDLLGEELEDEENKDPIFHFYHLAMTGNFNHRFLEWLKDMVKDAGLKRWEPNMNTMYQNISNHLFVNLLPALSRITVAITTLRGYALFYDGSSNFDVQPQLFSNILEHIDSLRLVAQRLQLIVITEHKQFRAFIKWLKMQLDVAAAGPYSKSALETEEREVPGLDYALVLAYIKNTLLSSKIALHVLNRPWMEGPLNMRDLASVSQLQDMSYERSKEVLLRLDALKEREEFTMKGVRDPLAHLNIPALAAALMGKVRVALQRITEWQSRMLVPPTSIPLNLEAETKISDIIHFPIPEKAGEVEVTETRLLALHAGTQQLEIISVTRSPTTSSNVNRRLTSSITLPAPRQASTTHNFPLGTILDAKWIPYHESSFLSLFRASEGEGAGQVSVIRHVIAADTLSAEVLHLFPANFKAETLGIGGRKGRLLCVVFGNRGREWRVLDLSVGLLEENEEAQAGAESMDVEEQF